MMFGNQISDMSLQISANNQKMIVVKIPPSDEKLVGQYFGLKRSLTILAMTMASGVARIFASLFANNPYYGVA